jgi:homoserine acetyltransferase
VKFCVLSFSSDWLYPTSESRDVVRALNGAGCRASFAEIEKEYFSPLLVETNHYVQKLQSQRSGKLARWVFFRHF